MLLSRQSVALETPNFTTMPTRNGEASSNNSLKSDLSSPYGSYAKYIDNEVKDTEKQNIFSAIQSGASDRMFESVTFPEAVKSLMGKSLAFEQSGYILQALETRELALSNDDFEVITKTMDKQLGLAENLLDYEKGKTGYTVYTDAGAFPKSGSQNPDKIARLQSVADDMYEAADRITKGLKQYSEVRDMSNRQMLRTPDGPALLGRASEGVLNAMIDFREARNKLTLGG